MELFQPILLGIHTALQWHNLLFCFIGAVIGTLIGVLPGIGPSGTIALLLPITLKLSPTTAIIMLAGIYYGAYYGGSITSILVNMPGEAASAVTCIDGYQMARKGRAGPALGMAALGSFIGGTLAILGLMLIAPPTANFALKFGPPEYFGLTLLGLVILSFMSSGPMWKSLLMASLGLFLGGIGLDAFTGTARFTLDIPQLFDGVGIVPVCMGVFGISEILLNAEEKSEKQIYDTEIKNLLPNLADWARSIGAICRGTLIGFFLGILPGGGAVLSSFFSYAAERKLSKHPEEFGQGAIEGVAGPETSNNAAATSSFIPLLSLGIPANPVMAVMMGGLMIHGVMIGPMLIGEHPDLFWGTIISMYLGNIMLLILNLPLIPMWVRILRVPYPILFPLILLFCILGSYSLANSSVDVLIMIVFGVLGYFMKKFGYDSAPLVLAIVLGPLLESALKRSLILSVGSPWIFFQRPISLILMCTAILLLVAPPLIRSIRTKGARETR
jgi:putative tricarboxylic transport membrane protein